MQNKSEVSVAFYIGRGNFVDWLIRWKTRSYISHCEIVTWDGESQTMNWYSSSGMDGGVRMKQRPVGDMYNPNGNWVFIPAPKDVSVQQIDDFYQKTKHIKYGYVDLILQNIFGIRFFDFQGMTCHEWCIKALGLNNLLPNTTPMDPGTLYDRLTHSNFIRI